MKILQSILAVTAGVTAGESDGDSPDSRFFRIGEWKQVYSQTGPIPNAFTSCSISSCDITVDDSNFLNFDQVKGLSSYRMKFEWDGKRTLEWTQPFNPLDPEIKGSDMKVCQNNGCKLSQGVKAVNFQGLSLSDQQGNTLMDGTSGSRWFYAVGWRKKYARYGAPSYMTSSVGGMVSLKSQKLFVWVDKTVEPTTTSTTTTTTTSTTTSASPLDVLFTQVKSFGDTFNSSFASDNKFKKNIVDPVYMISTRMRLTYEKFGCSGSADRKRRAASSTTCDHLVATVEEIRQWIREHLETCDNKRAQKRSWNYYNKLNRRANIIRILCPKRIAKAAKNINA